MTATAQPKHETKSLQDSTRLWERLISWRTKGVAAFQPQRASTTLHSFDTRSHNWRVHARSRYSFAAAPSASFFSFLAFLLLALSGSFRTRPSGFMLFVALFKERAFNAPCSAT